MRAVQIPSLRDGNARMTQAPDKTAGCSPALLAEAHRWLVLLQDAEAGPEAHRRFAAWRASSPGHAAAWDRTQRLWSDLDRLAPLLRDPEAAVETALAGPHLVPTRWKAARGKAAFGKAAFGGAAVGRRAWIGGALAASAALVVGAGYLDVGPWRAGDLRTAPGERRTFSLADGSTVELGSRSALSVSLTDRGRELELLGGEAFFTVADDPARPFTVRAGDGETTALGTAFAVRMEGERVTVTVSEHAVAVKAGGEGPVTLRQGQQVAYGPDRLGTPATVDLATALSWRKDRLIFQEVPLSQVVADLERHRPGRIVITDADVAAIPVTGVFDARRTDDALETIADTLPVRVTRLTGLLVLIRPR